MAASHKLLVQRLYEVPSFLVAIAGLDYKVDGTLYHTFYPALSKQANQALNCLLQLGAESSSLAPESSSPSPRVSIMQARYH